MCSESDPPRGFKVVASDLDGTLLSPKGKPDDLTASTLREVEALGIKLVLATSRPHQNASFIRDRMGIRAHLITVNGARAYDADGAQLLAHDIDPHVARALMRPEITDRHYVSAFHDAGWLVNRPHALSDAHLQAPGFSAQVTDLAAHDGAGLSMLTYTSNEDDIARLEAEIRERFEEQVCVTFITSFCIHVMSHEASKGRALKVTLGRMGATTEDCIAFGDGDNDVDMLSAAGHPFVMDKSSPKLLAALPNAPSAGSNAEAGVACTLRRLLRIGAR